MSNSKVFVVHLWWNPEGLLTDFFFLSHKQVLTWPSNVQQSAPTHCWGWCRHSATSRYHQMWYWGELSTARGPFGRPVPRQWNRLHRHHEVNLKEHRILFMQIQHMILFSQNYFIIILCHFMFSNDRNVSLMRLTSWDLVSGVTIVTAQAEIKLSRHWYLYFSPPVLWIITITEMSM